MGAAMQSSSARGGRGQRGGHRPMSEINVTPFVDVMLVLLVIFMVTAPMLTAGVDVDLPETKAAPLPGTDEPLSISVKANGTIYIQESKISLDQLGAKLQAITKAKTETRIFVRGDRKVDYGQVMKVVGEVNAAGFNKVALITDVAQE